MRALLMLMEVMLIGHLLAGDAPSGPLTADQGEELEVDSLVAQLAGRDWKSAAEELVAIGNPAVAPLVAALERKERWVSSRACYPLVAIGTPEALKAAYAAAAGSDYAIQAGAVLALGRARTPEAMDVIVGVLRSGRARMFAAQALGESGDPRAIGVLTQALSSDDKHLRGAVVQALARLGAVSAMGHLVERLEDSESSVRQQAREALVAMGGEVRPALVDSLGEVRPDVGWQLIWVIRRLPGASIADVLLPHLDDADWRVRTEAAIALSEIPSPALVERLERLRDSSGARVRSEARWILDQWREGGKRETEALNRPQPRFSVALPRVESISVAVYPDTLSERPDLPSPCVARDGQESVVARTKDGRYAAVPVRLENSERKGLQLRVDDADFPSLAETGLHDRQALAERHMITGRSLAEITELARPGGLSDSGFMAADEDIRSVLLGDDALVRAMGLTHADLAKPLFHVWNLVLTDFDLGRWNWAEHEWQNIEAIEYNGRTVRLAAGDTKGGQRSIFDDDLEGAFWMELWAELTPREEAWLSRRYGHLGAEAMAEFKESLTHITTGEMEAFYIMGYGFYEGHTAWRADPVALAFLFGIRSLEEIEMAFPARLDRVLNTHFVAP